MQEGQILVLYHWPCADGAFSALAARMSPLEGDKMAFIPHQTTRPLDIDGLPYAEKVYLLDYCGPSGFMRSLCAKYKEVILLDHHKTADEEVTRMLASPQGQPDNLRVKLDMRQSGCMAAIQHFGALGQIGAETLRLFEYVEDNDIWVHKLPESKTFTAGLQHFDFSYNFAEEPALFSTLFNLSVQQVIEHGKEELEIQRLYIEQALLQAIQVTGGPFDRCLAFEAAEYFAGISELGNQLALKSPASVGIVAFPSSEGNNMIKLSVRSIGPVDTTRFTSLYNGGGHANASGCVVTVDQWQKIKECFGVS